MPPPVAMQDGFVRARLGSQPTPRRRWAKCPRQTVNQDKWQIAAMSGCNFPPPSPVDWPSREACEEDSGVRSRSPSPRAPRSGVVYERPTERGDACRSDGLR
jgi:hypothetical protein